MPMREHCGYESGRREDLEAIGLILISLMSKELFAWDIEGPDMTPPQIKDPHSIKRKLD